MSFDLAALSRQHEGRSPEEILRAAADLFPGRLGFATGFGAEGCILIDVAARSRLDVDIFTLDTGLLFPETCELWKRLESTYGIKIRGVTPRRTVDQQAHDEGDRLWERDPDRCCELRKIEPLGGEVGKFDAWISAVRREQTEERANAQIFERDRRFGIVKVNPLVAWTNKDVWSYVLKHQVPYNPLHDHGYPSIGCQPCTSAVQPGEDPRAGRWRGKGKTECGLHIVPRQNASGLTPLTVEHG